MAAGDVTLSRGSSAALTITLASLASSSSRTAGRESTAIATASPTVDYLLGGVITAGTSPSAGTQIDVWLYGSLNDTPTYPGDGTIDGTDSDETITSENVRNSSMVLFASLVVDSTSDRKYYFAPKGIAQFFGGVLPKTWGVFVTHNTTVNLNSTGGNHVLSYTPVYANVAQS